MQRETIEHSIIKDKNKVFNMLVDELSDRIYWVVRKLVLIHEDANDVTQEVFLKVWKNLEKFKGESTYSTWVHRIAVNESLSFLDRKKRRISTSQWNERLFEELKSDVYFDGDEQVENFHKALLTLPEKQRLVFNLKYFENKKYTEIAQITETSEGALKASYHIAVKKIKEYLQKNE